jgi:hypothetical protein
MSGHTPGPWKASALAGDTELSWVETEREYRSIASLIRYPEMEANARLIAAAPELLAACKMVASFAQSWQPLTPGDIRVMLDAIAKAEGK